MLDPAKLELIVASMYRAPEVGCVSTDSSYRFSTVMDKLAQGVVELEKLEQQTALSTFNPHQDSEKGYHIGSNSSYNPFKGYSLNLYDGIAKPKMDASN